MEIKMMKNKHLIGFSLSLCIKDICNNLVDIDEVLYIQTGCKVLNEHDLEEVIKQYSETYWTAFPVKAKEIVHELIMDEDGSRIGWASSFPYKVSCNIAWGWWLSTNNALKFKL